MQNSPNNEVHGGIGGILENVNDISRIERPLHVPTGQQDVNKQWTMVLVKIIQNAMYSYKKHTVNMEIQKHFS